MRLKFSCSVLCNITHTLQRSVHAHVYSNSTIREHYLNGLFNLFLRISPVNPLTHFDHNHVATTPIDKCAIYLRSICIDQCARNVDLHKSQPWKLFLVFRV